MLRKINEYTLIFMPTAIRREGGKAFPLSLKFDHHARLSIHPTPRRSLYVLAVYGERMSEGKSEIYFEKWEMLIACSWMGKFMMLRARETI